MSLIESPILQFELCRRVFNKSILKGVCLSFEWDVPVLKTVGRPTHNVLMHESIESARSARSTRCLSIAPAGLVFQQALTALRAAACCDSTPGWRKRRVASPVRHSAHNRVQQKTKKRRDNPLAVPVISDSRQKTQKANSQ